MQLVSSRKRAHQQPPQPGKLYPPTCFKQQAGPTMGLQQVVSPGQVKPCFQLLQRSRMRYRNLHRSLKKEMQCSSFPQGNVPINSLPNRGNFTHRPASSSRPVPLWVSHQFVSPGQVKPCFQILHRIRNYPWAGSSGTLSTDLPQGRPAPPWAHIRL